MRTVLLAPMTAVEDIVATLAFMTFVGPREGKYATPVWAQSGGDLRARFTPKNDGRPATRGPRRDRRLTTFPGVGTARRPAKDHALPKARSVSRRSPCTVRLSPR